MRQTKPRFSFWLRLNFTKMASNISHKFAQRLFVLTHPLLPQISSWKLVHNKLVLNSIHLLRLLYSRFFFKLCQKPRNNLQNVFFCIQNFYKSSLEENRLQIFLFFEIKNRKFWLRQTKPCFSFWMRINFGKMASNNHVDLRKIGNFVRSKCYPEDIL